MSDSANLSKPLANTELPTAVSAAQDIDEELMFHVRSLVEENTAQGMSSDDAWANAQARFGSVQHYANETWRIDMGYSITIQRAAIAGAAIFGLLCVWLWLQVERLNAQNRALAQGNELIQQIVRNVSQSGNNAQQQTPLLTDFTGSVLDDEGKPLADAQLLVILKTWPGGKYNQDAFSARSDAQGQFILAKLVPSNEKYAVQVAAIKEGYAFKSDYQLKQGPATKEPAAVKLQLEKAKPLTLVFQDEAGQPVADVMVTANSRKSKDGKEQLVYFQSTEPFRLNSDAQGEVSFPYFAAGDSAKVFVQFPDHDVEERSFTVKKDEDKVIIKSKGQK